MALLEKDLPVVLCPQTDNPEGLKYQGRLRQVDKEHILIETLQSLEIAGKENVSVEFRVEDSNFRFETTVANLSGTNGILLVKPNVIHRSKVREGPRIPIDQAINYTIWTESGRFSGTALDMSESGVRMKTLKRLQRGMLLSLDFYMKDARIRVITQALAAWVKVDPDDERSYIAGIQFTTISNDSKKKLARHLETLVVPPPG